MEKTVGLKGRKGQVGRKQKYDIAFRRSVAQQYQNGNQSLAQVAADRGVGRYQVKDWVKQFSSELAAPTPVPMTEEEQKDLQALQKQIKALQKQLEHEQMKNFALETMIDLAKDELNIDLRKNSGAKQPEE